MSFLSDILLATGAFAAAIYCLVLSRRLKALTALDSGLGAAIAVLSAQVDELNSALKSARETAQGMSTRLSGQTERAESAARRLELLIAALHDLPGQAGKAGAAGGPAGAGAAGTARPPAGGLSGGFGGTPASHDQVPAPEAARARILRRRSPERVA